MIDVLVIEPDEKLRHQIVDHFKSIGGYDAEGVTNAEHGLCVFDEYDSFNTVVCALDEDTDVLTLIKRLRRRRCAIPIVILVDDSISSDDRSAIAAFPMVAIEEKPLDLEVVLTAVDEIVAESRTMGFQGQLERISLIDMIQLFCQTGKTGRLDIFHWGRRGHIYFGNGLVIHAVQAELDGAEAFYRLVGWDSGMFRTEFGVLPAIDTLGNESLHGLLIEALRRKDEAARGDAVLVKRVEAPNNMPVVPTGEQRLDLLEGTEPQRRMPILEPKVVQTLLAVEGVDAIIVVNRSGAILQVEGLEPDEEQSIGTLTAFIGSSCEASQKPIRAKRFASAIVVQSNKRKLFVVNTRNFFLGFVGSQHVNIETFRQKVLRAVARAATPGRKSRGNERRRPKEPIES